MKILNANINGLKSKYNKLVNYVKNENFDLKNIQEVHLKSNSNSKFITLRLYIHITT